jgi:hypothetical protein
MVSLSPEAQTAIQALGSDPEELLLWDEKIRDELLTALPGFRHCLHCSRQDQDDDVPASILVGEGLSHRNVWHQSTKGGRELSQNGSAIGS